MDPEAAVVSAYEMTAAPFTVLRQSNHLQTLPNVHSENRLWSEMTGVALFLLRKKKKKKDPVIITMLLKMLSNSLYVPCGTTGGV